MSAITSSLCAIHGRVQSEIEMWLQISLHIKTAECLATSRAVVSFIDSTVQSAHCIMNQKVHILWLELMFFKETSVFHIILPNNYISPRQIDLQPFAHNPRWLF
jgi:hypothetical protein